MSYMLRMTEEQLAEREARLAGTPHKPAQRDLLTGRFRQVGKPEPYELDEAKVFWDWVRLNEKRIPELLELYHVANGGHRWKAIAAALKATGVRPGRLDYNLDVPRGTFHGLRFELKRVKSGDTSKEQDAVIRRHKANGYRVVVCRGADKAIKAVQEYLALPKVTV